MAKAANSRTIKSGPAKSVMAKALTQAAKSNVVTIGGGGTAQGAALATAHYNAAKAESASWRRFFSEVLAMGPGEANKEYRKTLNKAKKEANAYSKDSGVAISRSAGVRMSECLTVAKAGDRGLTMAYIVEAFNALGKGLPKSEETVAHAWIVQSARKWNETHTVDGAEVSAEGSTTRRGNKPLSIGEKVKRYILSNYAPKDLPSISTLMTALAKRVKTPEDVKKELAKPDPATAPKITKKTERRAVKRAAMPEAIAA